MSVLEGFEEMRELEDGYAFAYPAAERWSTRLGEFIALERKCCPFVIFELQLQGQRSRLWLRMRGTKRVKEYLRARIGAAAATA